MVHQPAWGFAVPAGGKITQQIIMSRRQQLSASIENLRRCPLMHCASIAHRHSQEGSRVYCPAVLQQREEEVWPEAYTGMPDYSNFITGKYGAFSQRRRHRGEMAVHADITIMLDQHLQTTGTAVLNPQQPSRCNCAYRRTFGCR
jgi:hypothetical protein